MVRVGPLLALPAVLRSLGVDPPELLAELGLTGHFFEDPENTLSMALAGRLLGLCVERTGCEHFGLLVGQHAGASSLGALGYLIRSSATVGDALATFSRHLDVQDQGGTVWIDSEGSHSILGYTLFDAEVESLDQITACATAIGTNILRSLFGPPWRPEAVQFAFSRPRRPGPYERFFGVPPRFDADRSGIVFQSSLLSAEIGGRGNHLSPAARRSAPGARVSAAGERADDSDRNCRSPWIRRPRQLHPSVPAVDRIGPCPVARKSEAFAVCGSARTRST